MLGMDTRGAVIMASSILATGAVAFALGLSACGGTPAERADARAQAIKVASATVACARDIEPGTAPAQAAAQLAVCVIATLPTVQETCK